MTLFGAVHEGSSNSLLVWTENHETEDRYIASRLKVMCVQSAQSLVCRFSMCTPYVSVVRSKRPSDREDFH